MEALLAKHLSKGKIDTLKGLGFYSCIIDAMKDARGKSKLDLDKLQKLFDESLENETKESLTEWINKIRSENC